LKISIPELQQNLLASSPLKLQAKLLDYNWNYLEYFGQLIALLREMNSFNSVRLCF
jgi:hypothetical protein